MPGLTDDEVINEMKKMTAFIKQEALEKAREIKVKADEEFTLEKAKIVLQERNHIDATYEHKMKQVEIEKKIAQSNANNKSRLALLSLRDELLEEVFETARSSLSSSNANYPALLEKLVLQGLFTLMEKDVQVLCKEEDKSAVTTASKSAQAEYEKQTGIKGVKIEVLTDLPKGSKGGVVLRGFGTRIVVNNTLEERLKLLEQRMLPELRESLFGKNENRRFYN